MGKTVVITGATSGIGKACAKQFNDQGWDVALVGRNNEKLETLQQQLSGESYIFQCDLAQAMQVQQLCEKLVNFSFKNPLKALVNNAGIIFRKTASEHTQNDWLEQFQVNLFSAHALTASLYKQLKANAPATVINVSSSLAIRPVSECAAYSASKAAMNSWTQTLAIEWAKDRINVNAICPGIVNTPIHNLSEHPEKASIEESMHSAHPIGRMGSSEEIAHNIHFLTEPSSQWTTGSINVIDGGISLSS